MKPKLGHNFKLAPFHPKATRETNIWRCDDCDSEVIFSKMLNQREVNQIMAKRMPCLQEPPKKVLN